jgi:translation initiation factor 2B subunit (eIF-2B alpha/beta/delta family)
MTDADLQLLLREIYEDRSLGARQLADRALEIAEKASRNLEVDDITDLTAKLARLGEALGEARPSMTPLLNVMRAWRADREPRSSMTIDEFRQIAAKGAERIREQMQEQTRRVITHAVSLIQPGMRILTHSLSSTVAAVFETIRESDVSAIITESRPLNEGYSLAGKLSSWHIPATMITDAQTGLFVEQASMVLVGADTVRHDGAVVNKAGTLLLALAAKRAGVPFYACAERFRLRSSDMPALHHEEMSAEELDAPGWAGVKIRNIYFDTTAPDLVTGWITDRGILHSPENLAR